MGLSAWISRTKREGRHGKSSEDEMMKMMMMKLKLKNASSFPISSFASNQALSELSPSLLMGVVEAVGTVGEGEG